MIYLLSVENKIDIVGGIITLIFIVTCMVIVIFGLSKPRYRYDEHAHIIDVNLCYDHCHSDCYRGTCTLRFEDGSLIYTGVDNVVIFKGTICTYCGR